MLDSSEYQILVAESATRAELDARLVTACETRPELRTYLETYIGLITRICG